MTTVHTMLNGTPVVVMLLSWLMLRTSDGMTWLKGLAAVLLVGGIILTSDIDELIDIDADPRTLLGLFFAILAMFFSAAGSVITKTISKNFDKRVISSAIGFSILFVALVSVNLDSFLRERLKPPAFVDGQEELTEMFDLYKNLTLGLEKEVSEFIR